MEGAQADIVVVGSVAEEELSSVVEVNHKESESPQASGNTGGDIQVETATRGMRARSSKGPVLQSVEAQIQYDGR